MQLNPTKPIGGLLALFCVGYAIFTLLADDPVSRMNRMCTPITLWPGRVVVAAARVFSPDLSAGLAQRFNHGFYTCRRFAWGVLYQQEYEEEVHKRQEADRESVNSVTHGKGAASQTNAAPASAASTSSTDSGDNPNPAISY
jgi:hypothetical protein